MCHMMWQICKIGIACGRLVRLHVVAWYDWMWQLLRLVLHVVAGKIGCGRLVRLDGDGNCKKGLKSSSKSLWCSDPISLLLAGGEDDDEVGRGGDGDDDQVDGDDDDDHEDDDDFEVDG